MALALRRALILGGAIGAAMTGHLLAHGELAVTLTTPFSWGMLTFVAMLLGSRSHWKPRGFIRTTIVLAGLQTVVHISMAVAPWAFGMNLHHAGIAPSATMLFGHAIALLVAAILIAYAERMVSRAIGVIETIVDAFSRQPPQRQPALTRCLTATVQANIVGEARTHDARGPPLPLSF